MQCTSYVPVYYHARDVNVGASGFSWHPFDSNANFGEERAYKVAMPPYNMDPYVGYDKEVLKQIILNHEATFRYQVQELHQLYKRQRELMDEMRVREIFAHHLLSQTSESIHCLSHGRPEFSQTPSHATSWLLGDHLRNVQRPSKFVVENSQECPPAQPDPFIRRNSYNDVVYLLSSSKGSEDRIMDLELPAHRCHDDHGKQFKEGNISECPRELPDFQHARDSAIGSVKTGDLSSFDLNSRKTNCFIDLNEPIELDSLSSSSSGHFETCHMEIKFDSTFVPVEAIPKSVVPKCSRLMSCDDSLDVINSSVAIDLNSMPVSCFSDTEVTVENLWPTNKDAAVVLDHSSAYDHAMKNGKRVEDHPATHKMKDKFVKTEIEIDLNTGIGDEHSLPFSSSVDQIKTAEETELEGPVSPVNAECSPPRGKSEDIQVETPGLSEQGKGEPSMELDTIAAQTLVMFFSSGVEEYTNTSSLCWFAEIVSSTGDDLEYEIMKLKNYAGDNDQGEVPSNRAYDFEASTLKSKENALSFAHVKTEKVTGTSSNRSGKGRTRGTKRRKDFHTKLLPSLISLFEDLHTNEGFVETAGPLRRKAGRKACGQPRKYSKLSPSDVIISSILKQPTTRSKPGVLHGWGKIRKRQGGRRRRASEFLLIS